MGDLIDLDRARQNLPNAANADEPFVSTLVSAAGKAVKKYCRRDFEATSYDELYHGGGSCLVLKNYPVLSVEAVRTGPATVLGVRNTDTATNQYARVRVTATQLVLTRTANGVAATNSLGLSASATVAGLAGAVNALGNGWLATENGAYGKWPATDLLPTGALNARGVDAELKIHVEEVSGYEVDSARGWLLRTAPTGRDLFADGPFCWPQGVNQYRVQYTAGYAAVPEDVQEAVAELVATWFQQRGRDLSLRSESTAGTSAVTAEDPRDRLPGRVRALLAPYRNYRVVNWQG